MLIQILIINNLSLQFVMQLSHLKVLFKLKSRPLMQTQDQMIHQEAQLVNLVV
jgi:hypothetical protein